MCRETSRQCPPVSRTTRHGLDRGWCTPGRQREVAARPSWRGGGKMIAGGDCAAEAERPGLGERASPTDARSDQDLARRFAAGDPDGLRELYVRFAGPVFTVALGRLADRELAEEAMQETFVKAWRAAARFDVTRALSPWLYQIARRTAADLLRRERRRPATTALPPEMPAGEGPTFDDSWEKWEVRCALRDLSGEDHELLRLTHYVQLSQSEIAHRLGVPIGTIKSRVHRAHRRLAERLSHMEAAP